MSQTASQKFVELTMHGVQAWARRGEELMSQLVRTVAATNAGAPIFTPPGDIARASVWYSGMAVEPSGFSPEMFNPEMFSQDLVRLQASLAGTTTPAAAFTEQPVSASH